MQINELFHFQRLLFTLVVWPLQYVGLFVKLLDVRQFLFLITYKGALISPQEIKVQPNHGHELQVPLQK